ncbi:hypothetical protein D9599_27585 [Roseomonas sp. KE2513]|nr:hypothetical protein [Roseomonas sp. KE2513]
MRLPDDCFSQMQTATRRAAPFEGLTRAIGCLGVAVGRSGGLARPQGSVARMQPRMISPAGMRMLRILMAGEMWWHFGSA